MKKSIVKKMILLVFVFILGTRFFVGCSLRGDDEVVRIHIRANSNNEFDQSVKLKVRDSVVEYITPLISECDNSEQVKGVLNDNLNNIEVVANKVLLENGCCYSSNAKIENEYFPTRVYEDVSFPASYYDSLILRLGDGVGDNWWCVAYPPLCFVDNGTSDRVEYKSKLKEILSSLFW